MTWGANEYSPSEDKKFCLVVVCMVSRRPEVLPLAKVDAQMMSSLTELYHPNLWNS